LQIMVTILPHFCRNPHGMIDDMFGISLLVLFMIFIILVIAGILKKRDKIALKIAGSEEIKNVDAQIKWIPFAYRLVSVIGGMYCFGKSVGYIPMIIQSFIYKRQDTINYHQMNSIISLVILIIAGTYLICGAPHFVRWQTKKTIVMNES